MMKMCGLLISIMHANNEVGTIQPIEEIAAFAREGGAGCEVAAERRERDAIDYVLKRLLMSRRSSDAAMPGVLKR